MVLQHSFVGKSLLWHISYKIILLNAKVGTFPLSCAVIPSFIVSLPYFIFKFTIFFKILVNVKIL